MPRSHTTRCPTASYHRAHARWAAYFARRTAKALFVAVVATVFAIFDVIADAEASAPRSADSEPAQPRPGEPSPPPRKSPKEQSKEKAP